MIFVSGGCANLESGVLIRAGVSRQICRGNRYPRSDEKWYTELVPPSGGRCESWTDDNERILVNWR